uniref:MYB family transcription factor n=1 Tax=Melilotus albus TaxID=47082 RepID=A0A896WBU6_MELAB|nr:MYB family transcription factor [Melilotus albus]
MELDQGFAEKSKIPTMAPSQLGSSLSPPSHYPTYLYQNQFNQFKEHLLNEANHHSSFSTVIPSSISPIPMIPTSSYKAAHTNEFQREFTSSRNPMIFAPNYSKMEVMHGRLNTGKGIWDLSTKNIFQYGETSQPRRHKRIQKNGEIQHEDPNIIKGQWTANEDRILVQLVNRFGHRKWSKIAKFLKGRIGKQCRERWNNHLRPNIKKDSWTEEEDKILIEAHKIVGNKWAEIARRLTGRTENSVKNHWNATKRRLDAKRKKHGNSSKGKLLLKYIKEVTDAKEAEKEMMKNSMNMPNIGNQSNLQIVENDFSSKGLVTPNEENDGYVPMIFNGDGGKESGFGTTMHHEFGSYGLQFFPEIPMKQEIDLMKMIYRNP